MSDPSTLRALCHDERGALKTKPECRAAIINHLILEDMIDIDEAETTADSFLKGAELWPEEKTDINPTTDVS